MATPKPLLILIPGLDGTGKLFKPLLDFIPASFRTCVVTYPATEAVGFDAIVDQVERQIPKDEPIVLLAESFAGPIAVRLLQRHHEFQIQACIFCATFVNAPRPKLLGLIKFLPLNFLFNRPVPKVLLKRILLANNATDDLVEQVRNTLSVLPTKAIIARMELLPTIDVTHLLQSAPNIRYCYIQAKRDWLVPEFCATAFENGLEGVEVEKVEGGHFILQANPLDCWAVIERIILHD